MATFSPIDAAFEGFRIMREKPAAVLAWAALHLVSSFVTMGLAFGMAKTHALMRLQELRTETGADPAELAAVSRELEPFFAILFLIGLAMMAVSAAAVYRAVLRPSDKGFGYLKFGADELRLMLLTVIYIGLLSLLTFAIVLAVLLVFGLLGAALSRIAGVGALLAALPVGAATVGLMIFMGMRLVLAGSMTFERRRLQVFNSWSLTRGLFWRLVLAHLLAAIMAVIVIIASLLLFALLAMLIGGGFSAIPQAFNPDMSSLDSYLTPLTLLWLVFNAGLTAVAWMLLAAPAAAAYREIAMGADETFA
jgi:hypothetical protein